MNVEVRYAPDPIRFERLNTTELRDNFLVELYEHGKINLVYSFVDRAIVGSSVPAGEELNLDCPKELASEYFAQRREIGILNVGAKGTVTVDGVVYELDNIDALYIGRGAKKVVFGGDTANEPAKFYILSYPAHMAYPTSIAKKSEATPVTLGTDEQCNKRTIYKYIHPDGIKSCQLVMGVTILAKGSVWNTMPVHTHPRRSEIYMYFNMQPEDLILHLIGKPEETRHITVHDGQAVISPSWSIHTGCGIRNYSFCWAMGGENQDFNDMDWSDMSRFK